MPTQKSIMKAIGRPRRGKVLVADKKFHADILPKLALRGRMTGSEGFGKRYLYGDELLLNPGFEDAGDPDTFDEWADTAGDGAIALEETIIHGGAAAAKLTAGATVNTCITQAVTVVPGKTYQLSFWTRSGAANAGLYGVYDVTNSADIIAAVTTGVSGIVYTKVSKSFVAPVDCVSARLDLWCPAVNTKIAYFDDIHLIRTPQEF